MTSIDIAERFKLDTAKHKTAVLHDDGLYRHLRFTNSENGSIGSFELITWPFNLVVKAGWTFHFDIDATPDMLDLFRRTALTGEINPGYWAEKVRAGRDEVEGYDSELLKAEIEGSVKQWVKDRKSGRGAFETALREAVHDHFFMDDYDLEFESEAHQALSGFSFWPEGEEDRPPYYFAGWSEWRLKDFTPGFLHCCHAIRRGIDLWDAARTPVATVATGGVL